MGGSVRFVLRRSFRFGLLAGVVTGLVVALARVLGDREGAAPGAAPSPSGPRAVPDPWPRLDVDPADAAPRPAPATPDASAPAAQPAEPEPRTAATAAPETGRAGEATRAWVEPTGDVCPTSHPVKAKLRSKIFHVPGGLSYARTRPDRCYVDPDAAAADGLRPAKR